MNIREPVRSDLPDIKLILNDTELFPPEYLDEMIEPFFADPDKNKRWLVLETEDAGVAGFSYARPEALAEGTWNLLAIGFRQEQQAKGLGSKLIAKVEESLKQERVLIVETSGLDDFKDTRNFYETRGYVREAIIRDYWADGDDKVIYWKSLNV